MGSGRVSISTIAAAWRASRSLDRWFASFRVQGMQRQSIRGPQRVLGWLHFLQMQTSSFLQMNTPLMASQPPTDRRPNSLAS